MEASVMKKILPVLLVLTLMLTMASCGSALPAAAANAAPAASAQGAGLITIPRAADGDFKTPEDTLHYFTDCLKKNDFLAASKAFAIYEIPAHIDYAAYSDWLKITYMPSGQFPAQYKDINSAVLFGQAANCYKSAVLCLCGLDPSDMQVQNTADDTTNFIAAVSPDKLSATAMISEDMESTLSADMKDKHRQNMAVQAKAFGADECRTYVVTLSLGGNKADCDTLILLRYGSNWYISSGMFALPSQ